MGHESCLKARAVASFALISAAWLVAASAAPASAAPTWAEPAPEVRPAATAPKGPRVSLTLSLDAGGFFSSPWYVGAFRLQLERLKLRGLGYVNGVSRAPEAEELALSYPVVGPWLLLAKGGDQARSDAALLGIAGALQGIGLIALTGRWVKSLTASGPPAPVAAQHLELSFAPVAAGRLGLSVTLTGW